jgi:polysaccharide pyruvyl transferase WcaK-like protein
MSRALWDRLPAAARLEVELFPAHVLNRERYPARFEYLPVSENGAARAAEAGIPGLLACGTPVNETEGLDFPMRFIAERLRCFHQHGAPVDAVGVGIDWLHSKRGRQLFQEDFLPIRSWTVRTAACRDALIDLGVREDRIIVGADWAWLYRPRKDLREWGAKTWASLGIDLARPLLAVNLVNLVWRSRSDAKAEMASALDCLQFRHGFQIAFFCSECRSGEMFDFAAASDVKALMERPPVIVPNLYYSPDEALGLLAHVQIAVSARYHFAVLAAMAGTLPVCVVRGHKMRGLVEELGLAASCTIEKVDAAKLVDDVLSADSGRSESLETLKLLRTHMAVRATSNLAFFRMFHPDK